MPYVHIPDRPETLTADWTRAAYGALTARIPAAEQQAGAQAWLELFSDWNELKSYIDGEGSRRSHRRSQDLRDPRAKADERGMREQITPVAEAGDAELVAALLASTHAQAIGERFGEQLLRVLRVGEPTLAAVNSEARVREGELENRYDELVAAGRVTVAGESLTLTQARSLWNSDRAETRREAFLAYCGWLEAQRDALAGIFDELVQVRDEMGRRLGHANYIPLGYAAMKRLEFGVEEAASFRAAVREHVSPLFESLAHEQARALGTERLSPWDYSYHPHLSLPAGAAAPVAEQLDKLGRALASLSPRLHAHFERLRHEGRIDLETRPGKAGGAYCISFPDEANVAILCNSTGEEQDVRTLTHELGHAVQALESQWIEAIDLHDPSEDACEIHSMGLEFLCLPYLGEFFDPASLATFTRGRWRESIRVIVWVTLIDDFQHWVYAHPRASTSQREQEFVRLYALYMPGVDWSGEAEALRATNWYRILHLYRMPFYSIDYAMAELSAMQLGMLDARDHEACLATYFELCRLGGTLGVNALLQSAGLRSPFEPELVAELMAHARAQLLPAS